MLSLFLKSATNTAMGREALLAWICLGLLELSRANHAQMEDEGEVARPLFGRLRCFAKVGQRFLLQSEACFLRALQVCEHLQPGDDQLAALAWYGMGSVLALGGGMSAPSDVYLFSNARSHRISFTASTALPFISSLIPLIVISWNNLLIGWINYFYF